MASAREPVWVEEGDHADIPQEDTDEGWGVGLPHD